MFVGDHGGINKLSNDAVGSIDLCICNTEIVKKFIPEEAAIYTSIESFVAPDIEDLGVVFAFADHFLCNLGWLHRIDQQPSW